MAKTRDTSPLLRRNFKLFYIVTFFSSTSFMLPIYILFGTQYLGVSVFLAGALFLISWVTSLVLDFLTGSIADKYGRKNVFMIGIALHIIGLLPFVLTKSYPLLASFSVISGIGMALVSNTLHALVYEQAKEQGSEKDFQRASSTSGIMLFVGRVVASITGGIVYVIHPTLPYLCTLIALVIAFIAGMAMVFPKKIEQELEATSHPKIIKEAWDIFCKSPGLVHYALIAGLLSIWGDYIFNLYQPYYASQGVSSVTLGYIYAGLSLLSASGAFIMRRLPNRLSAHGINSLALFGVLLTAVLLLVCKLPIAYLAPIGLGIVAGFASPNLQLFVNARVPNHVRASVLSIVTTCTGIGSAIGIFAALNLVDILSFSSVLIISVIGLVVTLFINNIHKLKQNLA